MTRLLLLVLLALAATPGRAQNGSAAVRLDGRTVFRVAATDSLSAEERAAQVGRRLGRLLERDEPPGPVRVVPGARGPSLVVSGVTVVSVTAADAEWNLAPAEQLAAQWAAGLADALGQASGRRATAWSRFAAEAQGAVRGALGRLLESALTVVPRALAALFVLVVFGALARGVRRLMRALFTRVGDDATVENLVLQVAVTAVWIVGLVVALGTLGLDPEAAVAGLGLTSLALGFALKDVLSNFVSGLLLLGLRPFRIGDQIVVGQTEGSVERITLRATEIRTYGGRLVLVPNADVFTSRVTNNTASPVRRNLVTLHVGYGTDLRAATAALERAAGETAGVLAEPTPSVRVAALGPEAVELAVRFWTDSRRSDFVATASAVRAAAVAALRERGLPAGLPDGSMRVELDRAAPAPSTLGGPAGA